MPASRHRATSLVLAFLFFAVLIARSPAIWLEGRFFADEADYFAFAWHTSPFEALIAPHLGYWALWTNLATVLGAHALPLEFAPLPAVLFGTAALGTLVWAILRSGSPFRSVATRALALTLVLVVPPGYGRTNVTFAHFWFAATAAVLLVSDTQRRVLATRVLLVLAGVGGVVATFLTPVFLLRAVIDRSRERAVQAALLGSGALFQLIVYLSTGREHAARFVAPEPDVLSAALANHTLVHPLAGREVMLALGEQWAPRLAQADAAMTTWVTLACVFATCARLWADRAPQRGRSRRHRQPPVLGRLARARSARAGSPEPVGRHPLRRPTDQALLPDEPIPLLRDAERTVGSRDLGPGDRRDGAPTPCVPSLDRPPARRGSARVLLPNATFATRGPQLARRGRGLARRSEARARRLARAMATAATTAALRAPSSCGGVQSRTLRAKRPCRCARHRKRRAEPASDRKRSVRRSPSSRGHRRARPAARGSS